jgi:erythronate-4-phosphate dehydrogenase
MNNQPTIVVNRNTPRVTEIFSGLGHVRPLQTAEVTREAVRDADILIVRSETRVDGNLLEGSKVQFVGTLTIGTDHVDRRYLASKNIQFASAPGSNANSVAEYCAAALLVWSQRTGESLRDKTLGIVGVGNVGSKVARVGEALGMHVLLNDPPRARQSKDPAFRPLDELMDADVISLHVPLTTAGVDATHHLFDETRILRMKKGAVLMNTSRGPVVDSAALRSSLFSKHLSNAILDVWEGEPGIETALVDKAMIGTPHIAGYSLDGKLNAVRMIYEAVCRFLGTSPHWDADLGEEDSAPSRIRMGESAVPMEAAAYQVVRQAYDIELDDTMLRKILSVAPKEQGAYFMKLRAQYRIRREFFHRTVELAADQSAAREILEKLGFRVEVQETV